MHVIDIADLSVPAAFFPISLAFLTPVSYPAAQGLRTCSLSDPAARFDSTTSHCHTYNVTLSSRNPLPISYPYNLTGRVDTRMHVPSNSLRRSGLLLLFPCLFWGVVAFLPAPVLPTRDPSSSSLCLHAENNNNKEPNLLSKLFPPPSTTNPFASLGQQVTSFFEKLMSGGGGPPASSEALPPPTPEPRRRTGGPVSVVFGATGRAGREIVQALLKEGHDVIAAVRNESKLNEVFGSYALTGTTPAAPGQGLLDYVTGVDVTNAATLMEGDVPDVLREAAHVVVALGPVGGLQPGGGFGFFPGLTSEDVDYKGVVKVVDAVAAATGGGKKGGREVGRKVSMEEKEEKRQTLFRFETPEDVAKWQRLDDVIMG